MCSCALCPLSDFFPENLIFFYICKILTQSVSALLPSSFSAVENVAVGLFYCKSLLAFLVFSSGFRVPTAEL